MPITLSTTLLGLLTGLGLIVAIGAQNAFVLRQGLTRRHVGLVVAVCAVSDAALIVAGVAGVGAVITAHPAVVTVVRWVGAAYLIAFAVQSLRRAARPGALEAEGRAGTRRGTLLTVLALTWLNPHVYLDTVLLLGSVANQQGADRWWFATGAVTASVLWFGSLGFGARLLAPLFARPVTWRVLDVVIAVVMVTIAATLLLSA
ncbi:L-lysine exporter family protein LysE/ArgO [Terracoccus luteus]|uniref:L-lysine exporter family protein LysE/ArgO n=1 Tax=Terracoccus luteus TaxID=53356 RepID=A0A495Y3U7_9MICO|nr:LysE/ArgO family amino acid transporter [Terracoccus luteus]RKT79883.1 L-lysine exporter family protein LysE/ArgO [Terracoccus luteus]